MDTPKVDLQKLKALILPLSGQQNRDLVADIKKNGLLNPIVRFEGKVLDGAARETICRDLGIERRYVEFESLALSCSPADYLWSQNVTRRHLTDDQRAVLAFAWEKELKGEAKARQLDALNKGSEPGKKSGLAPESNRTRKEIAKRAHVTTHKIQQVETVKKRAPRLLKKVADGNMKLKDAVKAARPIAVMKPKKWTVAEALAESMTWITRGIDNALPRIDNPKAFLLALGPKIQALCADRAKASGKAKKAA